MKKIILLASSTLLFLSCNKNSKDEIFQNRSILSTLTLPPDANGEVHRIHNDVMNIHYHMGVVISSMYGLEPNDPNEAPKFSGGGVDGLNVSINGQVFLRSQKFLGYKYWSFWLIFWRYQ